MTPNESQPAPICSITNECPRCHNRFVCGIARGESHCWCMELPAVMPVGDKAQCLCPDCLTKAMDLARTKADEQTRVDSPTVAG